ncbi:Crp/Fnr family transcriptional regulator [Ruminococcus gauvreauii]|uniref:Crp/Fnr family transcriptional regulator n=1 Tax=Ruminococcus gauvreauii TaxID=438033 RepID=A0ABY5VCF4_9FIRM|nr:Crp/Fnr family transcriptional regulator [Ruminococcus gauvreauii]UWP58201.1 Crp/Fnr family transcriptional regulator [Ruminococcus gauvreauii]
MLTPRYFFTDDFSRFYEYFCSQPHRKRAVTKGEYLWEPERPFEKVHYILSGIAHNYLEHENGHRKIISFHSRGTVFPGYHQQNFKIEGALITKAISDMQVLEFSKAEFGIMFENNLQLSAAVVEWYSSYVNLLLYEAAHQEYNHSFIKLCNLLFLFTQNVSEGQALTIQLTQDEIADILAVNRVNLARHFARLRNEHIIATHRKRIEIVDLPALADYCSEETLPC